MPTPTARRCWCSPAAATWWSRTTGSAAPSSHVATRGIVQESDACSGATVTVAAGETWDDLVVAARSTAAGSGSRRSPASPAPSARRPIQNVGAYGQEVVPDGRAGAHLGPARTTGIAHPRRRRLRLRLPHQPVQGRARALRGAGRAVPARARRPRRARAATPSSPARLGVEVGQRAPMRRGARGGPRAAPLARAWCSTRPTTTPGAPARSSPTRSSPPAAVPEGAPAWPQPDGRVKTSAAWLIERAGFTKGYGAPGPAALSDKHTLALTNRGVGHHRRPAGAGRRDPRRRRTTASASCWCPNRCWSAASSRSAGQNSVIVGPDDPSVAMPTTSSSTTPITASTSSTVPMMPSDVARLRVAGAAELAVRRLDLAPGPGPDRPRERRGEQRQPAQAPTDQPDQAEDQRRRRLRVVRHLVGVPVLLAVRRP